MLVVLQFMLICRVFLARRQNLPHLGGDVGFGAKVDQPPSEGRCRFEVLHLEKNVQ